MRRASLLALTIVSIALSGCVYRLTVQQGNLVDVEKVEQVAVGMTRNQVRFLLGTPLVDDAFNKDRWDYLYYVKPGRKPATEKHWITVYFEDGKVARLDRGAVENEEPVTASNTP